MCKAMEDMRNEAKDGVLSYEKIAQYSGLTVDEVKELAAKQSA